MLFNYDGDLDPGVLKQFNHDNRNNYYKYHYLYFLCQGVPEKEMTNFFKCEDFIA